MNGRKTKTRVAKRSGGSSTGLLIAIEGIDGTGKGTQAQLMVAALKAAGLKVELFSFPAYEKTLAGGLIGAYLNNELGPVAQIDSRLTAMLFALDRYERKAALESALQKNDVVLCDRYVGSNLAHQAARALPRQRRALRTMVERLEYEIYGLPRPKMVLYLDMPDQLAQERVKLKGARGYTAKELDAHETDRAHLRAAAREYRWQARTQAGWVVIPTVGKGKKPLSREEIHQSMRKALSKARLVSFS